MQIVRHLFLENVVVFSRESSLNIRWTTNENCCTQGKGNPGIMMVKSLNYKNFKIFVTSFGYLETSNCYFQHETWSEIQNVRRTLCSIFIRTLRVGTYFVVILFQPADVNGSKSLRDNTLCIKIQEENSVIESITQYYSSAFSYYSHFFVPFNFGLTLTQQIS